MKSTTTILSAAALLFTTFISATPLQYRSSASTVITVQIDNQDTATTFSVMQDTLVSTGGITAVGASIDDGTLFCEAFSDPQGQSLLGAVFTSQVPLTLSASSTIAAFFCSTSQANLPSSSSSTTASATTSTTTSATTSTTTSTSATVIVQLEQSADQFVQATIPADGSVFQTAGSNLGTTGLVLSLVAATGADLSAVRCQAYLTAYAMTHAGGPATITTDDILTYDNNNPAPFGSIRCVVMN